MLDYSKGKIYTIRCRSNTEHIYVGSTTQPLSKRWGEHKSMSKKKENRLIYSTINNNWTDWFVELYEEYPCENKEQLCKREGEIIREIATLNIYISGQTQKEYQQKNADKIKNYRKEYFQANADKIKEQHKEYNKNNADKMKEYHREYYQANADKNKEYCQANAEKIKRRKKEYRQANADKIRKYQREYHQKKKLEKQQNIVQ